MCKASNSAHAFTLDSARLPMTLPMKLCVLLVKLASNKEEQNDDRDTGLAWEVKSLSRFHHVDFTHQDKPCMSMLMGHCYKRFWQIIHAMWCCRFAWHQYSRLSQRFTSRVRVSLQFTLHCTSHFLYLNSLIRLAICLSST